MKHKILFLFILISVLTGCITNRRSPLPSVAPIPAQVPGQVVQPILDNIKPDEEIKSFELEEKENPFNNVSQAKQGFEDDSSIEPNDELMEQERYAHSSRYGFKSIYYDFNDPNIRPDQIDIINNNLRIAEELTLKGYEVVVEGHACNSAGSRDYNIHLSESRAEGIADYFVKNGLDPQKISTVGRGCEMLIVPKGTREQQAPNRRVEIYAYPLRSKKNNKYKVVS